MNLATFFAMGGYGAYIWSCYGITAAVMIYMLWRARADLRAEIVHAQRRALIAEQQS